MSQIGDNLDQFIPLMRDYLVQELMPWIGGASGDELRLAVVHYSAWLVLLDQGALALGLPDPRVTLAAEITNANTLISQELAQAIDIEKQRCDFLGDPQSLNRIFEFSLRNRFLVLVFAALIVGVGIHSLGRLPIDAVPDVTPNQVQILTNAPGLGPVEVERFITFPVETAMSGLPGIEIIRSVSRFGLSAVTVYFDEGMDIYFSRRLVLERLPEAKDAIPALERFAERVFA